jgi:hypothetical protein
MFKPRNIAHFGMGPVLTQFAFYACSMLFAMNNTTESIWCIEVSAICFAPGMLIAASAVLVVPGRHRS